MRYDYECESCGAAIEHSCLMADRPDALVCQCGGNAARVFRSVPESFVRGRPFDFDPSKNLPSFGRQFGRTDAQQHAHYKEVIERKRNAVHADNRSHSRKDKEFEFIGVAPVESVLSFNRNVNDPEAAQTNPVEFHKRMGTYMGRD